jgi:hypothetical protein
VADHQGVRNQGRVMLLFRHPEVAAKAALEGCRPRRLGRRPSRLVALAPQDDGLLKEK